MSFFVKACVDALGPSPRATLKSATQISFITIIVTSASAVGGGKGLVVPVLRNAERMSFAEVELAIIRFCKARKGEQADAG
jgi:2-oxoglutarate dehydrogenase E2 component (dihydrolipoamide succinyltransferase)